MAKNTTLLEFLVPAIQQRMHNELNKVFEEMRAEFLLRMDRKKDEIIAGTAIDLSSRVAFETDGNKLTITVNKIQEKVGRGRPKKK